MSTIHYSTAELATVAKVLVTCRSWSASNAAEALEIISLANTIAYNDRYRTDSAEPSTAEQLEGLLRTTRVDVRTAAATVQMLPYNCDGLLDTKTRLEAMMNVTSSILSALLEDSRAD